MSSWPNSLAQLFLLHRSRLETLVTRRGHDRNAAPDLVQEAFARVLRAGSTGSTEGDTRILYTTARNVAIDHAMATSRRRSLLNAVTPDQMSSEVPTPQSELEGRQALLALDEALMELPERTREIFLMRRVDGLSISQIALHFAISVSAVEKHLLRAFRHCQSRLAHHLRAD